jgi:hypothetical protein
MGRLRRAGIGSFEQSLHLSHLFLQPISPVRVNARLGEKLPVGPKRFQDRGRGSEQLAGRCALVRHAQGGLGVRVSGEQASGQPNEWEHVPFADLFESTPRLAEQLSASQLLHPRGLFDRPDRRVEPLAQV